jgi:hypothetical protein
VLLELIKRIRGLSGRWRMTMTKGRVTLRIFVWGQGAAEKDDGESLGIRRMKSYLRGRVALVESIRGHGGFAVDVTSEAFSKLILARVSRWTEPAVALAGRLGCRVAHLLVVLSMVLIVVRSQHGVRHSAHSGQWSLYTGFVS